MNGWSAGKHNDLVTIINHYSPSFCLITETWFLSGADRVHVPNYAFFTQDRPILHRKAKSARGGVGISIHNTVLDTYKVYEIVNIAEGQQGIILKHHIRDYKLGLAVGYLPPDSSAYGQEPEEFFDALTRFIYA